MERTKMKPITNLRSTSVVTLSVLFFLSALAVTGAAGNSLPKIVKKVVTEKNARQKLSITFRYPQISGSANSVVFNRRAEQIAKQRVAEFKKDIGPAARGDRMRELDIGYTVALVTNDLISIGFGAGWDTGGAHPNSDSFVLNFDLASGRELALSDLFKPNSNYLRVISNYCIGQLMKEGLDREWVDEGAGPNLKNYRSWLIKRNGILVSFDSYQVASYADGPKEVLVPYSVLKGLVGTSSPVSPFVR